MVRIVLLRFSYFDQHLILLWIECTAFLFALVCLRHPCRRVQGR